MIVLFVKTWGTDTITKLKTLHSFLKNMQVSQLPQWWGKPNSNFNFWCHNYPSWPYILWHCAKVIAELTDDPYKMLEHKEFMRLRDALVMQLTIFNARRGSEPAGMKLSDCGWAERNDWIDPQTVHHTDDDEQLLAHVMCSNTPVHNATLAAGTVRLLK